MIATVTSRASQKATRTPSATAPKEKKKIAVKTSTRSDPSKKTARPGKVSKRAKSTRATKSSAVAKHTVSKPAKDKKIPKKTKKARGLASHPGYIAMIAAAIAQLKERSGSSRQAIFKAVLAAYADLGAQAKQRVSLPFSLYLFLALV